METQTSHSQMLKKTKNKPKNPTACFDPFILNEQLKTFQFLNSFRA